MCVYMYMYIRVCVCVLVDFESILTPLRELLRELHNFNLVILIFPRKVPPTRDIKIHLE